MPTNPSPKDEAPVEVVEYVGDKSTDVREITKAQWVKAGVDDQNLVRWSADNEFKVPVSELTNGALDVLRRDGSGFKVPGAKA